jgi:hypothetical protein
MGRLVFQRPVKPAMLAPEMFSTIKETIKEEQYDG